MYAPPLRRWRGQLPAWLARLGASGFPEAVISTGLFLYFEVFREPDVGQADDQPDAGQAHDGADAEAGKGVEVIHGAAS